MAYRSQEYVPGVYQPNNGRMSELIYAQGQTRANQMRNQGLSQALLWRGATDAATGVLSDLGKRMDEAPARAEAERKRKEADKLRGLQQMAGAWEDPVTKEKGMSQSAYGKLLQEEGFMDLGQDVLDKDTTRKAQQATIDDINRGRQERLTSKVVSKLYDLDKIQDPMQRAVTYDGMVEGLNKDLPEGYKLPKVYSQEQLSASISELQTASDQLNRSNLAKALYDETISKAKTEAEFAAGVRRQLDLTLANADEEVEWNNAFANARSMIASLPKDVQDRIMGQQPYQEQWVAGAHEKVKQMTRGEKLPGSPYAMAVQSYLESHDNQLPKTPAQYREFNEILRNVSPTATGQTIDPLQLARARNEAEEQLQKDVQYIKMNFFGDDVPKMLAQAQESYQAKIANLNNLGSGGGGYSGGGTSSGTSSGSGGATATGAARGPLSVERQSNGKFTVPFSCGDATCTLTVKFKLGKKSLSLKKVTLKQGAGKAQLKLSTSQKKWLAKKGKKKVTMTVTITGASGSSSQTLKF